MCLASLQEGRREAVTEGCMNNRTETTPLKIDLLNKYFTSCLIPWRKTGKRTLLAHAANVGEAEVESGPPRGLVPSPGQSGWSSVESGPPRGLTASPGQPGQSPAEVGSGAPRGLMPSPGQPEPCPLLPPGVCIGQEPELGLEPRTFKMSLGDLNHQAKQSLPALGFFCF